MAFSVILAPLTNFVNVNCNSQTCNEISNVTSAIYEPAYLRWRITNSNRVRFHGSENGKYDGKAIVVVDGL